MQKAMLVDFCTQHYLSFTNTQEDFFVWINDKWHAVKDLAHLKGMMPRII